MSEGSPRDEHYLAAHANPLFDAMIDHVTVGSPIRFSRRQESQCKEFWFPNKNSDVYRIVRIMSIVENAASPQ